MLLYFGSKGTPSVSQKASQKPTILSQQEEKKEAMLS